MAGKKENDISKLSFEDAIKQLSDIVSKIEGGQIPLQQSIEQYERGMALIKHCRGILQTAEKRIEKITDDKSEARNAKSETSTNDRNSNEVND